jgi:hypothetical protein
MVVTGERSALVALDDCGVTIVTKSEFEMLGVR